MKRFMIFILLTVFSVSCSGIFFPYPPEAMSIMENFSRTYTGFDTLIRTDGYYCHDDGTRYLKPFILSNNGEFQILNVQYENHIQIREDFRNITRTSRGIGHYILSGDTIKARWAMPYFIFSQQYLIVNDTTLRQIWQLCETCSNNEGKTKNEIYQFYKFSVDTK